MKAFLASVAFALLAPAPDRITIFVGPETRDGFVNVDQGIRDSIKDIQNALRSTREFAVVGTPDLAVLVLHVVGRRYAGERDAAAIPVGASVMIISNHARAIDAVLRFGGHEKVIVAVDEKRNQWKVAARQLVKDLKIWLAANRAQLTKE